jgi:hypothetical protein
LIINRTDHTGTDNEKAIQSGKSDEILLLRWAYWLYACCDADIDAGYASSGDPEEKQLDLKEHGHIIEVFPSEG